MEVACAVIGKPVEGARQVLHPLMVLMLVLVGRG